MKDYARSFYKGRAWRSTQAAYMSGRHYVCERCGDAARVVHHRRHITPRNIGDPSVTLDWKNLEALCLDCHNREHMTAPGCADGLAFDGRGDIVRVPPG